MIEKLDEGGVGFTGDKFARKKINEIITMVNGLEVWVKAVGEWHSGVSQVCEGILKDPLFKRKD